MVSFRFSGNTKDLGDLPGNTVLAQLTAESQSLRPFAGLTGTVFPTKNFLSLDVYGVDASVVLSNTFLEDKVEIPTFCKESK